MKKYIFLNLSLISMVFGQIKIGSVENLPVNSNERWSNPVFSPNGKEIFITNFEYNGIWQFSLSTKLLKVITTDRNSGFNFAISDDGKKIAYRRSTIEGDQSTRVQEIVECDLQTLSKTVLDRGNSISTPVYCINTATTLEKISKQNKFSSTMNASTQILGIDETKIAVLDNGVKKILDPLSNGSYIWPMLSPNKLNITAVEIDRGAFISDITGSAVVRLGKCNSPQWTRDGKWIIGMDDIDDGKFITGSEIIAVSVDGKTRINLTNTISQIEMFPSVSPVENKIIVSTASGELLLLTYEEGK